MSLLEYFAPTLLKDALEVLEHEDVSVVAGGTDFFPLLGDAPIRRSILDVNKIVGFCGITRTSNGWRIGAATTWSHVIGADLPSCFDGLKAAAREIGSVQIQNVATLAGNLCNASPAGDGIVPLLAMDAQVELVSKAGIRVLGILEFVNGVRKTALTSQELVSAILIPDTQEHCRSSFLKIGSRKYLIISITMVAVVLRIMSGRISDAAVAVGACSPVACRLPDLENALIGCDYTSCNNVMRPEFLAPLSPISDIRGSADYRLDVVSELCGRAVVAAFASEGSVHG